MKIFDALTYDFVSMLEGYGIIRNMKFWSAMLSILCTLHFIMAVLVLLFLPLFPSDMHLSQVFLAVLFACIGFTWFRVSKECSRRIRHEE